MPKKDLHLTIEQLSAYIDGQLSPAEQVHSDTHLKTCEPCRQSLAGLRLTVQALHSLPRPAVPRSFVLPVSFGAAEQIEATGEEAEPASEAVTPISRSRLDGNITPLHRPKQPRRQPWPGYITGPLKAVSSLAAVVAILLLVSSLLMSLPHSGGAANSTTASSTGGAYYRTQTPPDLNHTPPTSATTQGSKAEADHGKSTPTQIATPAASPDTTFQPETNGASQPQSVSPLPITTWLMALNPLTASGQAISGTLLLALAILGFFLLRLQRKRTGY